MIKKGRSDSKREKQGRKKRGWWSRFLDRLAKANRDYRGGCRN